MRIGGKGATVANRLPSAAHGVAAAGGRSLNDASTPSVGGSEGPSTEAADFSTSSGTGEVYELTMPKLGESVTEGTIGTWLKAVGDDVAFDDPLFDVSTDKVDSEIPSPYDGTMLEILVQADETVPVGTVLARIGDAGPAMRPDRQAMATAAGPPTPSSPACRRGRPSLPSPARRGRSAAVPAGAQARRRARLDVSGDTGHRSRWADPSRGRGEGDRLGPDPLTAAPAAAAAAAPRRPQGDQGPRPTAATKWCR